MAAIYLADTRQVWCRPAPEGGFRCVLGDVGEAAPGLEVLDWVQAVSAAPVGVVVTPSAPFADSRPFGLRDLFAAVPASDYAVAAEAVPVAEWRRTSVFCGACGGRMERSGEERCQVCPACGHRLYPRINPAVITCVRRGDRILMARRAAAYPGFHTLIAGFVEVGESLEHALRREVREEVGIEIANLRYFGSQPWPFPSGLMVGFFSNWAGGELRPDGAEIAEASWYAPDALPPLPRPDSIAYRLVQAALGEIAAQA